MTETTFKSKLQKQQSLCMAYLAASGELLKGDKNTVEQQILGYINNSMKKIPLLCINKVPDWEVVWGPAIYTLPGATFQDNMMFVAQQLSNPANYIVGIRGTNAKALLDWILEDFDVKDKVEWDTAGNPANGTPKISKATNTGFNALLNHMTDSKSGQDITTFLTQIAAQGLITLNFAGHSLGGALAPTLALWFKQSQGQEPGWDHKNNATVTTTPFAGATAGTADFAAYSDTILGDSCDRIHNMNDIVPHAWEKTSLEQIWDLYASIRLNLNEFDKLAIEAVANLVGDYTQINVSDPFTFALSNDPKVDTFASQAAYQHNKSYPMQFDVPELNEKGVINKG